MNKARRQHWVPCFYLRYFATQGTRDTADPLVWVFSKDEGNPMLTSVRQIAAQCFLYSPKDRAGKRQWAMEDKLKDLEGVMGSIWPVLADGMVHLHENLGFRKAVALFVSTLYLRHPKRLSEVENLHAQLVEAYDAFPKDEAGRPLVESIEHNGVVQPFDNSNWLEYKISGPNERKRMFVDSINQHAMQCAEILMKKRWFVVFSDAPVFITTDTPVNVVNPNRDVFGLDTPGTQLFFPLSPTRILVMDDRHDQPKGLYYPLLDDANGAGLFNMIAWHHAERFMISPRHTDAVCAELLALSEGHDQGPATSALPVT